MTPQQALLRQYGPLLFFVLISMLFNVMSSGLGEAPGAQYRFDLKPTYAFSERLETYRLNQIYYVSQYTLRDLQHNP
jgi:hypothetical protein